MTWGGGGWDRVYSLNMSEPSTTCPPNFNPITVNGMLVCDLPQLSVGQCQSVNVSVGGFTYSEVGGRVFVVGYASPDAFSPFARPIDSTLEDV